MTIPDSKPFPLSDDTALRNLMLPEGDGDAQVDLEQLETNIQRYIKVRAYLSQPVTGEWLKELGFRETKYTDGFSTFYPSLYHRDVVFSTKDNKLYLGDSSTPAETRQQVIHVLDLFNIPYNKPEIL